MARVRVKVCCIASPDEARMAIAAGADAVGLVGAMPSGPGPIPDEVIAKIAAAVPPPVASFLLSSERDADALARHVARTGVGTLQIVSPVEPEQLARLRQLIPATRLVQVIHVEDAGALELIPAYAPYVHAFLLDSGRPSEARLGGTGETHDWRISRDFVAASPVPVFLAGGLTARNVGEAIRMVRPFGVDLCTGVRSEERLDGDALAAFMRAVDAA